MSLLIGVLATRTCCENGGAGEGKPGCQVKSHKGQHAGTGGQST
jgi:hypothetical protein